MSKLLTLIPRILELVKLIPSVINLYNQIRNFSTITDKDSLVTILNYVKNKNKTFEKYVSEGEVLMLVCSIIGLLHEGDSSELYKVVQKCNTQD